MNCWHTIPAEIYALVDRTPATVLLESASGNAFPFSRLFIAPQRVLVARKAPELTTLLAEMEAAVAADQFCAGYFAYECGQAFEPKAALRRAESFSDQAQPPCLAWFGVYERCFLFDHHSGAFLDGDPPGLEALKIAPKLGAPGLAFETGETSTPIPQFELALTERQYAQRIAAIHEWIRSGDVYQLNFTVPLRIETAARPAQLYRQLRRRQSAPYSAFLHCQTGQRVLCFSPELFFRIDREGATRRITTQPMKGTAQRGRTTNEDRAQAVWLRNDSKNRAENLMIVDLLRNDLGRLCRFGSVRVDQLFAVERYPTLWQMTSTVSGELRPEIGLQQLLHALFPCGSITGAPKLRAMQLIDELEAEPRGIYTGAIGFFAREKTVFNVAIRTLELKEDADGFQCGQMGIGSGIVIDSDPASEFRECLLKAQFLTESATSRPEEFSLIETMLWRGDFPFLDLHLDRLADSADYFGFPCDRGEIRESLLSFAERFGGHSPHKLRLLLDADGSFRIASELLPDPPPTEPIRVRIATERTDPRDPMLFHKTTHRPLYSAAFNAAIAAGYNDVLFLNQREEVTESAIANLFIERDGLWLTPPIECGLLAGVQRRFLLESRPEIQQKVLSIDDLRQAGAIYLSNAVRGLRRARIDWESR